MAAGSVGGEIIGRGVCLSGCHVYYAGICIPQSFKFQFCVSEDINWPPFPCGTRDKGKVRGDSLTSRFDSNHDPRLTIRFISRLLIIL